MARKSLEQWIGALGFLFAACALILLGRALLASPAGAWFQDHFGLAAALTLFLVMVLAAPYQQFLCGLADRAGILARRTPLSTLVAQAGHAIALIQGLKWLARRIAAFLVVKCQVKNAAIYVCSANTGTFYRSAIRGYRQAEYPPRVIPESHLLLRYLCDARKALKKGEIEAHIRKDLGAAKETGLQSVLDFFQGCQAEVIIPSFLRKRMHQEGAEKESEALNHTEEITLRSILVLGPKVGGELYDQTDLEVFYSLAQESALAIENARLHDEVQMKTKLLGDINRELMDLHEKLRATQASLVTAEKKATMVGMAQAIGHEVNNPLTTVLMRIDVVYRDKLRKCREQLATFAADIAAEKHAAFQTLLDSISEDIDRAGRAAHRINAVVHTLTDILRSARGEMSALSLRVLFHEAIEATRFSTDEGDLAGCDIKLDVVSSVMVRGNLEQLLQVFVNLIKNAYEAMQKNTSRMIKIVGQVDPENPVMAKITVKDNGPGISAEILPKIWMQGFTTKIRTDEGLGAAGQGQGLFVCKHLIESVHRGKILCDSAPGSGTQFTIWLPLAEMGAALNHG